MLTRRQFAIGSAAMASTSLIGARVGKASSARFDTPLPIPELVDAAKQGNAERLKIASARHAFLHGKPARTYGYSASFLGPVIRVRNGDDVEMTVENALDRETTVHWHGLSMPSRPHRKDRTGSCPLLGRPRFFRIT
jgi:blue copper oxidase